MRPHYDPRYVNQLVELAESNRCKGIIEEPRVFYDVVDLSTDGSGVASFGNDAFVNGDQFPMRFTHMILTPIPNGSPDFDDERLVQLVGVRLRYHDTFYMNDQFVPAPNWMNKVVATGPGVTQSSVSMIFDRPAILSARDSLRVESSLLVAPDTSRLVSAAFTGVGLLSKRPYFRGSQLTIDAGPPTIFTFPAADFKNDGGEPIALTDMTLTVGPESGAEDANGDARLGALQVKILGNGTQADWFESSSAPTLQRCPAGLLAVSTGRSVVHRFPGDGMLFEPGDGLTAEALAMDNAVDGMRFGISMVGYISVT